MADSNLPRTIVEIFGANIKPCNDCGPGITEEEAFESVRLGLGRRFGPTVQVFYHSLLDPAERKAHAATLARARELGVPLPITAVDGTILMGGGIDYRAILNAIELKGEIEEQKSALASDRPIPE